MERKKNILITGIAGFVGYHLAKKLSKDFNIIGLDNLNSYYDTELKLDRLKLLGFKNDNISYQLSSNKSIMFYKEDLKNKTSLEKIFKFHKLHCVVNLAAQAGVRFSLNHPDQYIESNILGFYNLLEVIKKYEVKNFIYASSSSVYGELNQGKFKESFPSNNQISLYAATKKTNEIFAQTYSNMNEINSVGLRFFTVYGPYGRPDMAYYKFTEKLLNGSKIKIYNYGKQRRDFTYVDDIVEGIKEIINSIGQKKLEPIYNIGFGRPVELKTLITSIEKNFNKKFKVDYIEKQPGDVTHTYADISLMKRDFNYAPRFKFEYGIKLFCDWYKSKNNL